MPQPPARQFSGIFVSYRRDDTAGHAGRLFDRLVSHFGKDRIFMDIDTIEPGEDFVTVIENAVGSCEILIAVIGRQWLSSTGRDTGRLDNPNDFVRVEIAAALSRDVRVIPVLVQRATMPTPQDLPDDLAKLTRRNAVELTDLHWQNDVDQLISFMDKVLARLDESARALRQAEEQRKHREEEERARAEAKERSRAEQEKEHFRARSKQEEDRRRPEEKQSVRIEEYPIGLVPEEVEFPNSAEKTPLASREQEWVKPDVQSATSAPTYFRAVRPSDTPAITNATQPLLVKMLNKRRMLLLVIAGVTIVAGVALIRFWWANRNVTRTSTQTDGQTTAVVNRNVTPTSTQPAGQPTAVAKLASTASENTSLGDELYKQDRFTEAEPYHREALRLQPNNAGRHNDLGDDLYGRQKYVEAETYFREAVRLQPDEAIYNNNLGLALNAQMKYADAEPYLRKAVRLQPGKADYNAHLGDALNSQKKYVEAESYYREAVRLQPHEALYNIKLGGVLNAQLKYTDAELYFREAERLQPNPMNNNNLGDVLYNQKRYGDSEPYFREAVRLQPDNALYNNDLGDALYYQQKYEEAEAKYREAVRLDPNNSRYQENVKKARQKIGP